MDFEHRINHCLTVLRKIFLNFFQHHEDFDKTNEEIKLGIIEMVKKEITSILLLENYVNEVISKTFEKYKMKEEANKATINEYLRSIYSSIITCTYSYLYPDSWL